MNAHHSVRTKISLGTIGLLAGLLAIPAPALGHHSATMFDDSRVVELAGTVREFQWTNPHTWIQVVVAGENGEAVEWSIEGGGPNSLARRGWRPTTFEPGDEITIRIRPMRNGAPAGLFVGARFADGSTIGRWEDTGQGQAQLTDSPDRIETDDGPLTVHPVLHGSLILEWNGIDVYLDPFGDASLYADKSDPDLILITHEHDDHFNLETLNGLNTENARFIVPQVVADAMPARYRERATVIENGGSLRMSGVAISAVPMYNLPEDGARHAKGVGNGYVLTMGGRDVYVSGDTEDIPEMRSLTGIDVAFVCMNLPYTMDVDQAAGAVADFEPEIVYPYHHRGQDIEAFRDLVDAAGVDVEVRLKNWYPGQ